MKAAVESLYYFCLLPLLFCPKFLQRVEYPSDGLFFPMQENLHPAGFFLKVKILLKSGASDEDISSGSTVLCRCHGKVMLFHVRLDSLSEWIEKGKTSISLLCVLEEFSHAKCHSSDLAFGP